MSFRWPSSERGSEATGKETFKIAVNRSNYKRFVNLSCGIINIDKHFVIHFPIQCEWVFQATMFVRCDALDSFLTCALQSMRTNDFRYCRDKRFGDTVHALCINIIHFRVVFVLSLSLTRFHARSYHVEFVCWLSFCCAVAVATFDTNFYFFDVPILVSPCA